jgi:peptidoglycan/LPS O-acetylase OafA/YrhL
VPTTTPARPPATTAGSPRQAKVALPRPKATAHWPAVAWSAEVQALRALAVGLVLLYHLWPGRVTGGYVGVDVFFVISGYLISGHILRDLAAHRFSLAAFYARRAARLLPAAMLVLLFTGLGVVILLPQTRWIESGQQVLASALYVQNWVLAGQDVDYLSPEVIPTPVQHFWSLSVEEQFYFVWPVALMLTAWLARRAGRRTRVRVVFGVMLAVAVASFVHGVLATASDATGAYFFSTTRVWEFALGGMLALVVAMGGRRVALLLPSRAGSRPARVLLCWAGLAAIVASALLYTDRTPFPGWAALLPVAGTMAVIGAGSMSGAWSPERLVHARPTQVLGDVSYSLYLWHWPLIMLAPAALGEENLRWHGKLAVLALSIALAWLSTTLVENRLRATSAGIPRARRAFVFIAATGVVTAVVAGGAWYQVKDGIEDSRRLAEQAIAAGTPCFGAAAMTTPGCELPPFGDDVVTPHPAGAEDAFRNATERQGCFTSLAKSTVLPCTFGPPDADFHVVLLGDSHALQWLWALEAISRERGWRLTTLLRASCTPTTARMDRPTETEENRCHSWAKRATTLVAEDPSVDVVVTTAYNNKIWQREPGLDEYTTGVESYRRTWERFTTGGRHVVVLKDTPAPGAHTLDCVDGSRDGAGCERPRDRALRISRPDPMVAAAHRSDPRSVHLVDLTDSFCDEEKCPTVIGNVLVYADVSHISPTYSRTLAPILRDRLLTALGRS